MHRTRVPRRLPSALRRHLSLGVLSLLCGVPPLAPEAAAGTAAEPPRGEVVRSVACAGIPDQSYALYLPSTYASDRRWPVVYVLEPAARGWLPVETMKHAAERHGLIVVASNNSRNGPMRPSLEALAAMWEDTHARFSLDDRRVYFGGFSGGARMASQFAQACKCAQGVFLNGAGLAGGSSPPKEPGHPVFATVGTTDFNYGELATLDLRLDALGVPHVLRRFEGPHQWAPPEVWDEAFGWMSLLEMKDGRRARDLSVVRVALDSGLARARGFEEGGEPYLALREYKGIVATFQGLADVAVATARAAALEKSPEARKGADREKADIESEESISVAPRRALSALSDRNADPLPAWRDARFEVERLRDGAAGEKDPRRRRVLQRARAGVGAQIVETGLALLAEEDYGTARRYFELGTLLAPEAPGMRISLARSLAALGDRKGALRELAIAKEHGANVAELPERFSEIAPLASDPRFGELARKTTDEVAPP